MTSDSGEPAGESRGPTSFALIIGGMKCGTTSLFELLAQHPEVAPCRVKEPDFFAEDVDPRAAWDRYLGLWDWEPGRHRIALEASTAYAKFPWVKGVPERVAGSPDGARFKFIYMMRDPIRRIGSQVRHGLYDGWGQDLDEGLTEDLIDFSRYAMQLDRFTAHFPRDAIHLLTLEELHRSPHEALRSVCDFLGVSPGHEFEEPGEARNTGSFYTLPPLVAGLARNRFAKGFVDALLPRDIRSRLRRYLATYGRGEATDLGRWRLNDEEAAQVRYRLAADYGRLRDHYGVRESWIPQDRGHPDASDGAAAQVDDPSVERA